MTPPVPPTLPPRRGLMVLRLALVPVLLGAMVWWAGPAALWAAVREARVGWLVAGLGSALAANLAAVWRWQALVRWLGHPVRTGWLLAVYFRSMAVNALMPGAMVGGDMFRIWSLQRQGCSLPAASASVVLDRLGGLWMLYVLGALGLWAGAHAPEAEMLRRWAGWPSSWPLAGLAAGVLAAVLTLPWAGLLGWRAAHRWQRRHTVLSRPGGWRQGAVQMTSGLVAQLFSVGALACAAQAFGVSLPWWLMAATAVPIFMMAALPVSFGGWGTREAATVAAWASSGVAASAAVGASVTFGVYALVLACLGLLWAPPEAPAPAPA